MVVYYVSLKKTIYSQAKYTTMLEAYFRQLKISIEDVKSKGHSSKSIRTKDKDYGEINKGGMKG